MSDKTKVPVAVLISGRGSNMGALIAASLEKNYPAKIVLVISDKPDAKGLEHARDFGIEAVAIPRSDYDSKPDHEAAVSAAIAASGAQIIALAGYMRLLSGEFVQRYSGRMINIHPSLLPAFPGLATHSRALSAGCRVHGCTVHFVTEAMDEGPIIEQEAVRVAHDDTPDTLSQRVLEAEHRIYPKALAMLARGDVRMSRDGRALFKDSIT
ncbi:phosphoribosylglycinamide formyltransferase [Hoeflea ulvae]|uniref:Phosphoribosylglycinamide formyltransferase n=1 Tax=Hoeflea ulvae TaxID=2983764 RepID=A0ABT3YF79_9HYPH|nr:phosphoribosylglycinamide formyltransferase [Hoeflea ulvae]MCY0094540.1 phosphoribosylglycinamide formyltransferase [Hoeflea ulvae]